MLALWQSFAFPLRLMKKPLAVSLCAQQKHLFSCTQWHWQANVSIDEPMVRPLQGEPQTKGLCGLIVIAQDSICNTWFRPGSWTGKRGPGLRKHLVYCQFTSQRWTWDYFLIFWISWSALGPCWPPQLLPQFTFDFILHQNPKMVLYCMCTNESCGEANKGRGMLYNSESKERTANSPLTGSSKTYE